MKKSYIILIFTVVTFAFTSCTPTDITDDIVSVNCCGDDGPLLPSPPINEN